MSKSSWSIWMPKQDKCEKDEFDGFVVRNPFYVFRNQDERIGGHVITMKEIDSDAVDGKCAQCESHWMRYALDHCRAVYDDDFVRHVLTMVGEMEDFSGNMANVWMTTCVRMVWDERHGTSMSIVEHFVQEHRFDWMKAYTSGNDYSKYITQDININKPAYDIKWATTNDNTSGWEKYTTAKPVYTSSWSTSGGR